MKKQLLLLVMMLSMATNAFSVEVEIDGLWYEIVSKTKEAKVIQYKNNLKYGGNIVIPETIEYDGTNYIITGIGKFAFAYCYTLSSISIPNSLINIGEFAFEGCISLSTITIPNGVTNIGDYAFEGCTSLTSIIIPSSITDIRDYVFNGCKALSFVTIPNSITRIGKYAFGGCESLNSIIIPNSVTIFGYGVFERCSGLTSVTIPDGVKTIPFNSFMDCSNLTIINLGIGIETISQKAFANCPELTDLYCNAENVPSAKSDTFEGSHIEQATLHVPDASVNLYKTEEPWKNFKEIVGVNGTPSEPTKCEKPTIIYKNGELAFSSATEGVEFVADITDSDVKKHYSATISLTATYNINVYATKTGYDNSDVATATLCWVTQEPQTEGITNGVAQIPAKAVLIQSDGGIVKVEGIDDGTPVTIYTPDSKQAGSAVSRNGAALVGTSIQPGNVAIVKIGEKSVKVVVK